MTASKNRIFLTLLCLAMLCTTILGFSVPAYSKEAVGSQVTDEDVKTSSFQTSGRIWIAGDSIAADHSYESEADYARFVHGWGEMIGKYLTEDAQVFNKAISGQTAKFFTEESNYHDIINGIGKGDFLLIQFGHNDYKSAGTDHWELPTSTEGSYKWYLKNYYIDPALEAGAMPVLCTSVVQCRVDAETGMIGDGQAQKKFAIAMRTLYEEYLQQGIQIGFIDTYALTQTYLNCSWINKDYYYALKYDRGNTSSTSLDRVHFSEAGADMTANMIAQNLMLKYADFNRFSKNEIVDGGAGTKEEPYLISTWCQLYQIMLDDEKNTPDTYYKLTEDLYPMLQQQEWTTVFRANLDGDQHIIHNGVGTSLGAVFDENYGTISNLTLNYHLNHTASTMQAVFIKDNYGTISNCTAKGSAAYSFFGGEDHSVWNLGAFACVNHAGAIIDGCSNMLQIEVYGNVPQVFLGGIAGRNEGTISNCSNVADLLIDTYEYDTSIENPTFSKVLCCSGGIAGIVTEDSEVMNCSGTKIPENKTTLVYVINIMLADEMVAVTEEELQEMITDRNTSKEPEGSKEPGSSNPPAMPEPEESQIPSGSPEPITFVKGDLDSDKEVTLQDAQLALRIALNILEPEGTQLLAADLNGDSKVDLDEVQRILKAALKIIDKL